MAKAKQEAIIEITLTNEQLSQLIKTDASLIKTSFLSKLAEGTPCEVTVMSGNILRKLPNVTVTYRLCKYDNGKEERISFAADISCQMNIGDRIKGTVIENSKGYKNLVPELINERQVE